MVLKLCKIGVYQPKNGITNKTINRKVNITYCFQVAHQHFSLSVAVAAPEIVQNTFDHHPPLDTN